MARRPAAPVPPERLYQRRLAVRALSIVLEQLNLGGIVLRLNADDPAQALQASPDEVLLFEPRPGVRSHQPAAIVHLKEARARVVVEQVMRLVRHNHLATFAPEELGIDSKPGWPDIDVEVDLADLIEVEGELLRTAPQRPTPPGGPGFQAKVIRSCSGRGS